MALQPQYEPQHITAGIVKWGMEKSLAYRTDLGALYEGDCLDLFPWIESDSVDTVFADPPFNLAKQYGKAVNDEKSDEEYLVWCRKWLDECIRVITGRI